MNVALEQPRVAGDVIDFGLEGLIQQLAELHLTGRVLFMPNRVELFFEHGDFIAARGSELLGSILLRRGAITASQLQQAIATQASLSLGEVLLATPFSMRPAMLQDAIQIQILRVIQDLFEDAPETFAVYHSEDTLPIHTRIPVAAAFAEVLPRLHRTLLEEIHLGTVLRLNAFFPKQAIQLEPDQWMVATLLDGRRNVASVVQMYQIQLPRQNNPEKRILSALSAMYQLGLVEIVDYSGLDGIVLKQLSTRISSYVQQQFLLLANGKRNLTEIGAYLGLDAPQTTEIAVSLYRHHFLEVQQGLMDFERLLEEF